VNFVWERLAEGVHRARLPFLDVTVGLVESDAGALLVDTGTTLSEAAAIDGDVRAIANSPVTRIILTHKHFDHVLGSSAFTRAEIYCSPEVAAYMSAKAEKAELRADALRHGADAAEVDQAVAALRKPDHLVYDIDVDLGDRSVSIRHPGRGHTDTDLIAVVPPAGATDRTVVFCGDLVEESGDPAIDADSDVAAWPSTLDRLLDLGGLNAVYVPGHGAVVDAAFIRRQRTWLHGRV
jgi:glyoxylase-like metal-dependent hydrolase (beta-lactamase superfamily II)